MTEQEITQARADLAQLDIDQLRCGVMLQLLKIEALTKERDALAAAGKRALEAMHSVNYAVANGAITADVHVFLRGMSALRQAGVQ